MSKKNKIVYSDVQPNAKEAGVWVNTTDGNVKIEKDGKWVDDGGSSSGGDDNVIYYKFSEPFYLGIDNRLKQGLNFFSGARGYYNAPTHGYYYGTIDTISGIVGSSFSDYAYTDAFEFRPVQFLKSGRDQSIVIYNDFESIVEAHPEPFGVLEFSRITKEEYWEHFNAA